MIISVGIEGKGNSSMEQSEVINHSLSPFDDVNSWIKGFAQRINARKGSTGLSLFASISSLDEIYEWLDYKISTCTLYALNFTLSVPIDLALGNIGLAKGKYL